jgi:hypothetical protein
MTTSKRTLRRLDARLARALFPRGVTAGTVVAYVAAFALIGWAILLAIKFTQNIHEDSAEAYAWGRQFLWGYGRHPPLTGWIAGLWYLVFPASNWASYLLSRVLVLVSLTSIYFLARRVLDPRRAALIVFTMMLYPYFVGAKSDRLNNYQVLLALMPLLVWAFLVAYEKCDIRSGALLGLVGAAAALTIYSALLGLFAIAIAALLHADRIRFLRSPAPYVAVATFLIVISPHVVWSIERGFPTLQWAQSLTNTGIEYWQSVNYLGHQTGLIAIPLLGAALTLVPWRMAPSQARPPSERLAPRRDAFLVLVIASVLILGPPLIAIPLRVHLKLEWGDPFFFLVPVALLILMPRLLITRRALTRAAVLAAGACVVYLCVAPVYALIMIEQRPDRDVYMPTSELAVAVTRLWRERFSSPLPIVLSAFELAAPITFYSSDHPRMFADSPDLPRVFAADQPEFSPWIDYPSDLRRNGFVGICLAHDSPCLDYEARLDPEAEKMQVTLQRETAGRKAQPWTFEVSIARPQNPPSK